MAAQVGHYPSQYHDNMGMSNINTDPGVYEPECDWNEPVGPTGQSCNEDSTKILCISWT